MQPSWPKHLPAMLSKTKRPYDPAALPAEKRLRANVQDLFANNLLSGTRIQELINDAAGAGASSMDSLTRKEGKNATRHLRSKFLKRNQWPNLYWARIRVKDKATQAEVTQSCAFLLPHELLDVLHRLGDRSMLHATDGLEPKSLEHLLKMQGPLGQPLVALGLWGDGVPCNWDRTESVEVFSLNLPGQGDKYSNLRLPLTGLSRKQISEHTFDDIMEVLVWSLRHCYAGTFPRCRHDGAAFSKSDQKRKKLYEKSDYQLGIRGTLVEVRGDWKMYQEIFKFPAWNMKVGCCWRCKATPDEA
jgi:hypothetical protein